MRMVKLISNPHTVWEKGQPTQQKKCSTAFINPKYVISIEPVEKGGSMVTVIGAMVKTYTDHRSPDTLAVLFSNGE
jgi:hypothetical protein